MEVIVYYPFASTSFISSFPLSFSLWKSASNSKIISVAAAPNPAMGVFKKGTGSETRLFLYSRRGKCRGRSIPLAREARSLKKEKKEDVLSLPERHPTEVPCLIWNISDTFRWFLRSSRCVSVFFRPLSTTCIVVRANIIHTRAPVAQHESEGAFHSAAALSGKAIKSSRSHAFVFSCDTFSRRFLPPSLPPSPPSCAAWYSTEAARWPRRIQLLLP